MIRQTTMIAIIAATAAFTTYAAQTDPGRVALENAKKMDVIDGDLVSAVKQYNEIISAYKSQRSVVAEALFRLAEAYRKLGDPRARQTYQRLVLEYADQKGYARSSADPDW